MYQISSPPVRQCVVGEQSRRKRHPETQGRPLWGRPAASVATPIAADASTVRTGCRVQPRPLAWRSGLWREVSNLFTTDRWFQGNERRGSVLQTKKSASSPPGFQNLLCFQLQLLRWGWKRKTPPERWLGRGSIYSNCGRALRHSSLARARARATQCKALGVPFQIVDHALHVGALGSRGRPSLHEGCGV